MGINIANDDRVKLLKETFYEDGSIKVKIYCDGEMEEDAIWKLEAYYKNGSIHCLQYLKGIGSNGYDALQYHGMSKGFYKNGQIAKEIFFQNDKPIFGSYYKKSGLKKEMTQHQMEARIKQD